MKKGQSGKKSNEVVVYTSKYNHEYIEEEVRYKVKEEGLTEETARQWAHDDYNEMLTQEFDFITTAIQEAKLLFLDGEGGSWRGKHRILRTLTPREFFSAIDVYDDIIIKENGFGRVTFKGSHHDGSDTFEIRRVNDKGIARYHNTGMGVGACKRHKGFSDNELTDSLTSNFRLRKAIGHI